MWTFCCPASDPSRQTLFVTEKRKPGSVAGLSVVKLRAAFLQLSDLVVFFRARRILRIEPFILEFNPLVLSHRDV